LQRRELCIAAGMARGRPPWLQPQRPWREKATAVFNTGRAPSACFTKFTPWTAVILEGVRCSAGHPHITCIRSAGAPSVSVGVASACAGAKAGALALAHNNESSLEFPSRRSMTAVGAAAWSHCTGSLLVYISSCHPLDWAAFPFHGLLCALVDSPAAGPDPCRVGPLSASLRLFRPHDSSRKRATLETSLPCPPTCPYTLLHPSIQHTLPAFRSTRPTTNLGASSTSS
jgi:hypothetical protein